MTKAQDDEFGPVLALELVRKSTERIAEPYKREIESANERADRLSQEILFQYSANESLQSLQLNKIARFSSAVAAIGEWAVFAFLFIGFVYSLYAAYQGVPLKVYSLVIILVVVLGSLTLFSYELERGYEERYS